MCCVIKLILNSLLLWVISAMGKLLLCRSAASPASFLHFSKQLLALQDATSSPLFLLWLARDKRHTGAQTSTCKGLAALCSLLGTAPAAGNVWWQWSATAWEDAEQSRKDKARRRGRVQCLCLSPQPPPGCVPHWVLHSCCACCVLAMDTWNRRYSGTGASY